jgi:pimeloyl-ACP methyl ester carboxylesterase
MPATRTSREVEVEGCRIHYLQWGERSAPGLILVPPGAAHAHWFDHVAPILADQFNVAAVDLSGCGDSGRRESYTREMIVAEIMAVCADAGMLEGPVKPTLVGHSAGAQYALRAAVAHGAELLGVIAVDGLRYARLAKDHAVKALEGERQPPRPPRVYPSLDEAASRFRLRPEPLAPIDAPEILAHIARHSFRQVEGAWVSKYDAAQGTTIDLALDLLDALPELQCHSAAIFAEHTHLADETAAEMIGQASGGRTVVFTIPGTTHYPFIDSPAAYVAAIKGVVFSWVAASRA